MDGERDRARVISDLAEAALVEVEATRRTVEGLLAVLSGSRHAPAVAAAPAEVVRTAPERAMAAAFDVPRAVSIDSARLVAIEMAVAGGTREEVRIHLASSYELDDAEALLDDVFGPDGANGRGGHPA